MEIFEIRLRDMRLAAPLLFVTTRQNGDEAVAHARRLLERHPEYDIAEIWSGMEMVCQI